MNMKATVKEAARLLDHYYGSDEWAECINLSTLNIIDYEHCIAGQLGHYWYGFSERLMRIQCEQYGIKFVHRHQDIPALVNIIGAFSYHDVKPHWAREVRDRIANRRRLGLN
jgi:hypothetical protein